MHADRPASIFRFGTFEVDTDAGELRKHGIRIKLQEQPFQLLVLLLQRPGEVITREELRHTLWSDQTFVDFDRGLNRAMNKLRAALCDSPETPRFIETLHRRGYRFIAPITVLHPLSQTVESPALAASSVAPDHFASAPRIDRRRNERRTSTANPLPPLTRRFHYSYWLGVIAALAVLTAALSYVRLHPTKIRGNSEAALTPRRSVTVLGFKNLSERSDEDWVSTALSDWLTTQLAAGGHLRLVPEENVARMKIELSPLDVGRLNNENLKRIGQNLSTDLVVVGSYAVVGTGPKAQIRLDLRLQDARNGNIVEAVSEIGTEAHLFDLVLNAGERLRAALGVRPVSGAEAAEVAVALPASHDAARLYSEGQEALRVFDAVGAREFFQRAISVEPDFALSHSALATTWATLGYDDLAKAEAKRAFELSSNLPRAERLLVEARYHEMSKEWDKAVGIYRALFQFFPDSLDYGLALADAQVNNGRGKDAVETLRVLHQLPTPLGNDARIDLAEAYAAESLGDFKTDLACTMRAAEKARALGASLLLAEAKDDQAWALANLGRADEAADADLEAERIFAKAGDKRGLARSINYDGILMENQGNAVGAKKRYEEALDIYRQIGNKLGMAAEIDDLGDVSFSLGDLDASRRNYEKAMAIYREIGHEDGVCLTKGALGSVLLALGDDAGSVGISAEAVDICSRLQDRSKVAIALVSLGRALHLQGKTSEAMEKESNAIGIFEEIGDKQSAARARLMFAELLLDEGKLQQAKLSADKAADEFVKEKAARDAALAFAVLSQVLLQQGSLREARESIQNAQAHLSKCSDREAELMVAISNAQIQGSSGGLSKGGAAKTLQQIATEANRLGFVPYELEPRLAAAEIEVNLGDVNARSHLEALQKEATDRGFGLIALKAAGDLKNLVQSTPNRD